MHLDKLVGTRAKIIEIMRHGDTIYGCWVALPGAFLNEQEWFIPYYSIGI